MVKSMMRRMINLIFSLPAHKNVNILLILSEDVNLSAPRYKSGGLPFDKLKAPSTAEGLKVDPECRFT
jgi:hypothetical protein